MQDFRKLEVWKKAHELVLETYRCTGSIAERRFPGLSSQLRRAASAVPANIAEGCGHGSQKEFARFLQIAVASSHELHYHLMLCRDLEILPLAAFARLEARTEQVKKMLGGLLAKVRGDLAGETRGKPAAVSRRP
jgi:four helix bundle protein